MRSIAPLFLVALAASAPVLGAEVVPVPAFQSIELRGGGDVMLVPGRVQRVTLIQGSTQFTRFHMRRDGQLQIDACNEHCPHNYPLQIRIESPRVPVLAIAGGGTIRTGGGFAPQDNLVAAVTGGGTIDVRTVVASDVSAAINGGGDIYTRPRSSLAAAVNGGGDVHYGGNPRVSMVVHGGGDVRRDD
jgi:putative autotransporter adhesin-like protein